MAGGLAAEGLGPLELVVGPLDLDAKPNDSADLSTARQSQPDDPAQRVS